METRNRAAALGNQIGSYHMNVNIDKVVTALVETFAEASDGNTPRFTAHGGSVRENLALQNVQARSRMVMSYLFAQLNLWTRDRRGGKNEKGKYIIGLQLIAAPPNTWKIS